jgi:hypothetical protein
VLIIADERTARDVYAELFRMRGYAVTIATGARAGLRALMARPRHFCIAVVAVANGALPLRRRLLRVQPRLRVHLTGRERVPFDLFAPRPRPSLLH